MSESDDGDNVPLHPTARKPAFTPSKDYLQYLDLGGELAQLGSLKDQRALKAAVLAMKNRTISELSIAIDETGQAIDSDRDEIDDMPTGNDQLVAARSLLAKCLTLPNDMLIFLTTHPPSELRRFAVDIGCDKELC